MIWKSPSKFPIPCNRSGYTRFKSSVELIVTPLVIINRAMVCHGRTIVGRRYRWPVAQMSFRRDSTIVQQFGVHTLEGPHWKDIPLRASANVNLQSRITLSAPLHREISRFVNISSLPSLSVTLLNSKCWNVSSSLLSSLTRSWWTVCLLPRLPDRDCERGRLGF